ncbi:hypothetical protein QFC19_003823 [Naganishia cerealis]|uniref:Uncharacterized protein n=1 Tax=Naganishia cerealis TaxID=610337 RepID=A0ACC2W192_9TREE|nr:hypothetical protein QFC19_003823 [Naganishia cerealis]
MPPALPFKAKVVVSWAGEEEGDLGFLENEVVEVYLFVDDSWWSGKLRRNGAEGIFPKEYVKVMESNMSNSTSETSLAQKPDLRSKSPYKLLSRLGTYESYDNSAELPSWVSPGRASRNKYASKSRGDTSYSSPANNRHSMISLDEYHQRHERNTYNRRDGRNIQSRQSGDRKEPATPPYNSRSPYRVDYSSNGSSPTKLGRRDRDHFSDLPNYRKKNHTVESLSPEHSPSARHYKTEQIDDPDLLDLSIRRQQLELELERLKLIEKSKRQSKSPKPPFKYKNHEGSFDSSYVSEDVLSSKRNIVSRDNLSHKFSMEEEDNDGSCDSSQESPPPPPKHSISRTSPEHSRVYESNFEESPVQKRVPFDADDFKFSGNGSGKIVLSDEDLFILSQMELEELKNSIKSLQSDVLNLSELSATSAGSFVRHKYEKERQLVIEKSPLHNRQLSSENRELMESIFQDKKSRHPNIFKKLLQKKKDDINPLEEKFLKEEPVDWATFKTELNRANSLTSQDKQARTKRVTREENHVIIKPLDYVSDININETTDEKEGSNINFEDMSFSKVETFMSHYDHTSDLNEIISDVSVKFNSSKINQIRCVLLHLCRFKVFSEPNKISQAKPKLAEVLHKGEASIYQINYLFKKILDALRIPSELVLGFWKKPNEFYHDEQFIINHSWLSILVDNQYLLMDILCFKNGTYCNLQNAPTGFNEYYFLAKPLNLVSTHIPSIIEAQHVIPPIDHSVAFYLPRIYSGFYKNHIKFRNFNNALTKLKDLEIMELELEIPLDVELFTLVKTSKITTNELCLCQVYWVNNSRFAKIKAVLPHNESVGVLQIFAGPKGLQKHFNNVHELAVVIPLCHLGISKPCKFVPRYPTVQSQNNDLYVKLPQTGRIFAKNSFNFEVLQHPSTGVNSGTGLINQSFRLVIESPSGKYFKLVKTSPNLPFSSYEVNIKCQEIGIYRGLVIGDAGNSWYVFAQWESVAASGND